MIKSALAVVAALGLAGLVALGAIAGGHSAEGDPYETPVATRDDLAKVAASKVFFGHKSVGFNVLDGLPAVYDEAGVARPAVVESREAPSEAGIFHTEIGENGQPLEKIAEFDRIMRGGMADSVDVAILKLCYVDLREGQADVDDVFAAYRDTVTQLARDFPDTAFVAATSPLTVERGPRGKINALLGRGDRYGPEHNVLRERFNALMRAEYTEPGTLFDIAAIQSTAADGQRVAFVRDGKTYYSLNQAYAKDPGHLNPSGGAVAASAFVAVIADALA